MPNADGLERLRSATDALLPRFVERKERARKRIGDDGERHLIHVALLGIEVEGAPLSIDKLCILRAVEDAPGEIELAAALADKTMLATVARYSHHVRYELCLERDAVQAKANVLTLAWWLVVAIRVRVNSDFLAAVASNHSWSAIAGAPEGTCEVVMLEDVPRARSFASPSPIRQVDFDWVAANFESLVALLEIPRFRLAVDSLTTHPLEASLRMATASLWAGVEAIFAISAELSFRVAAYMAAYLEPAGSARISLFKQVKGLYTFRSKVVHGASVKDAEIVEHVRTVRALLCRLLIKAIEERHLPEAAEWDEVLLG